MRTNTRERLRGGVSEVQCRRAGRRNLPRCIPRNAFRTCDAGREGAQPLPRCIPNAFRRAAPVARERNPTALHTQEMHSGRAAPVARERNPTAVHTQECVPDVQRRTLPTEGIEPTHCCQYWILSPARLPIPPRRLFARRQLLIRLHPNASANDAISQLLRRRIPVSDLFHSPTSVLSYQRIVILGQNIQHLQILTCSHIP